MQLQSHSNANKVMLASFGCKARKHSRQNWKLFKGQTFLVELYYILTLTSNPNPNSNPVPCPLSFFRQHLSFFTQCERTGPLLSGRLVCAPGPYKTCHCVLCCCCRCTVCRSKHSKHIGSLSVCPLREVSRSAVPDTCTGASQLLPLFEFSQIKCSANK